MISNKTLLSIPKPCHENWEEMTTLEKGKFCNSCQKEVFDFTIASDREILKFLEKNTSLCGRFHSTQLNRELVKPKEKKSLWFAITTSLMTILSFNEIVAQEKAKTEQTDKKAINNSNLKEPDEIEVSGIVSDKLGPLPGANVVIKGTPIGTSTDFDGNFKLNAKIGDVLQISFVGYERIEYVVNNKMINVELNLLLKEGVTLGAICIKRKTFFGRIFQSIGNWFR